MRQDALGLFWRDEPPPARIKKEKVKRTPPEPVWLADDYYPNLDIALATQFPLLTDKEIVEHAVKGTLLEFDIEVYKNYTLIGFRTFDADRKYIIFEQIPGQCSINTEKLKWVINNFVTVGFNNKAYDNPMTALALLGLDTYQLKEASDMIIAAKINGYAVMKHHKTSYKKLGIDWKCIDLMNVAPRRASLKKYSARCGIEQIQDLPYPEDAVLDEKRRAILKWYWGNDLNSNEILHSHKDMLERIDLRVKMGQKYGVELRDKSDPQIAEAIFVSEAERLTGDRPRKANLDNYKGTSFRYYAPNYLQFKSATMQHIKTLVDNAPFIIDFDAQLSAPVLQGLKFDIGDTTYTMGIGGLHSNEKSRFFISSNGWKLKDHDVTSYYPNLILTLGMYPEAIGRIFLQIYEQIKNDRVHAKRIKDKVTNESLKIVINGSFGKFGDPYSYLFAPSLLIQTTLTGQLCILMLIERLELAGIKVVSANTDGLVTYAHDSQDALMAEIIQQWQIDTGLELEHTIYNALYSRDVNNYFAIKEDGKVKGKGAFAESNLELDPKYEVCADAVKNLCSKGIPIEQTIKECRDIKKFVMVKSVTSGAVQGGQYLGKVARYYKSVEELPEMVIAKSGNKVPMSDCGRQCQRLPTLFPDDVYFDWYIAESYRMLKQVGVDYYEQG